MGYPSDEARGALRLSLGRSTSDADVEAATFILQEVIARQRDGVAALAGTAPVPATPVVEGLA
jgi:cysteine desulfurase